MGISGSIGKMLLFEAFALIVGTTCSGNLTLDIGISIVAGSIHFCW